MFYSNELSGSFDFTKLRRSGGKPGGSKSIRKFMYMLFNIRTSSENRPVSLRSIRLTHTLNQIKGYSQVIKGQQLP